MSLTDFTPSRQEISHKGKVLVEVRGLNTDDVSALVRGHMQELSSFARMISPDGKLLPNLDDVDALLFSLVTKFPTTAAKMIALASDEPDAIDAARRLPFPTQMEILLTVVKLTFEDVGGPLAFRALVRQMMEGFRSASPRPSIQ